VLLADRIRTCLEEVRLPEPDVPIEIERIVRASWAARNCFTCSMSELCRWADDEVVELIPVTSETTIESFDYFYSLDLLFFGGFFRFFEGVSTVYDEIFSLSIHIIIDDDIEGSDRGIDFAYGFFYFIVELLQEIVPMK
jgi:hypothetical protein